MTIIIMIMIITKITMIIMMMIMLVVKMIPRHFTGQAAHRLVIRQPVVVRQAGLLDSGRTWKPIRELPGAGVAACPLLGAWAWRRLHRAVGWALVPALPSPLRVAVRQASFLASDRTWKLLRELPAVGAAGYLARGAWVWCNPERVFGWALVPTLLSPLRCGFHLSGIPVINKWSLLWFPNYIYDTDDVRVCSSNEKLDYLLPPSPPSWVANCHPNSSTQCPANSQGQGSE